MRGRAPRLGAARRRCWRRRAHGPRWVLWAGVLLCAVAHGCRRSDEAGTPAGAVRAFVRAADSRSTSRNRQRVISLIGPRTRTRLTARARLAAQQAGARQPFKWEEMLVVGMARPSFELASVRVIEQRPPAPGRLAQALVEVRGPHGEREVVEVVEEGGTWKLELPAPREPPPAASASAPASTSQPAR